MPSPTADEYTLTTAEAAALLGASPSALSRWADEGRLPCLRTPGRYRKFRPEDIDAFAATLLPDQPAAAQ